ncbi:hypothetical protein PDESU_06263 [Pontiella desulfatans]|uniref:Uncharacterized protein n=1 Tax=Pontiella desulfatans TaxID=2750659 RepID=A0A6C2UBW5_PONDE|nr:hypothetical protein [Pontiella desulfatans]VGO17662.1 hypothetical protein PDESU_06263 [Pontiella desulfatans]
MNEKPVKRRLKRFAFSATAYVAGVVAFSTWSYVENRETLLRDIDENLANGAFAIREILGNDYTQSLELVGSPDSAAYRALQKQLGRFANNGGFNVVGAVVRKSPGSYSLIAGTADKEPGLDATKAVDAVPHNIRELVLDLATASDEHGLTLLTTDHSRYGRLRIAAFYKGTTNGTGIAYMVARKVDHANSMLREQAIRKAASGLFLLLMAVPLVLLYNQAQLRASKELAVLNSQLKQDVEGRKERESELQDAIHDLERFNAVTAGRENRIIELKAEVNELLQQVNRPQRYNIDKAD